MASLGSLFILRKSSRSNRSDPTEGEGCKCECCNRRRESSPNAEHARSRPRSRTQTSLAQTPSWNAGKRGSVKKHLLRASTYITAAAPYRFDDSDFKGGDAREFPVVPAEELRNQELERTITLYNRSRAPSVVSARTPLDSPHSPGSPQSGRRTSPTGRRPHSNTLPGTASTRERHRHRSSSSSSPPGDSSLVRAPTLEVPKVVYPPVRRNTLSDAPRPSVDTMSGAQQTPTIVVSTDPDVP